MKKIVLNGKKKTVETCRKHFDKRWYQRVGNHIPSMFVIINKAINNEMPHAEEYITFVWKESNTRTHYRIKLSEKNYIVVYNKNLKCAITIFEEPNSNFYNYVE